MIRDGGSGSPALLEDLDEAGRVTGPIETAGAAGAATDRAAIARIRGEEIRGIGSAPGTYVLVLRSAGGAAVRVGRREAFVTRPGVYLYAGSAFGPGGIRARVGRHRRVVKSLHWHIDYLRPATELDEVWYSHDPVRRECHWAAVLHHLSGSCSPLDGFGASDCGCATHLVQFDAAPSFATFRRRARAPSTAGTVRG